MSTQHNESLAENASTNGNGVWEDAAESGIKFAKDESGIKFGIRFTNRQLLGAALVAVGAVVGKRVLTAQSVQRVAESAVETAKEEVAS